MTPEAHFVHDDRFVEPFANRPHTVLGKRLLPYSLWTHCNLEWAQSPFLLGNRIPNMHDLWVAVQCASTPWTPEHYVPDLAVPPLRSWRGLRWLLRVRRYRYRMELAKFYAYLSDFAGGPKLWSDAKAEEVAGRIPDVDENLELATYAEHEFKWPPSLAWSMPLGQLRWRVVMVNRFKGGNCRIWSPIDEALAEQCKAKREAEIVTEIETILKRHPTWTPERARESAEVLHAAKVKAARNAPPQKMPRPPRVEPI
jgi:hypothetical protein